MEKEYGELYYLDLKELITPKRNMTEQQREFVASYLLKHGVDIEEDTLITVSPMDSATLGFQILDIIVEYEKHLKTSPLNK